MSVADRYSIAELRRLANTARSAGLGEDGLALYALCLGLAMEKQDADAYFEKVQALKIEKAGRQRPPRPFRIPRIS